MRGSTHSVITQTRFVWIPISFLLQFGAIYQTLLFLDSRFVNSKFLGSMELQLFSIFLAIFPTYFIQHRILNQQDSKENLLGILESLGIQARTSPKSLSVKDTSLLDDVFLKLIESKFDDGNLDIDFELRLGEAARLTGRFDSALKHFEMIIAQDLSEEMAWYRSRAMTLRAYTLQLKLDMKVIREKYEPESVEVQEILNNYAEAYDYANDIHDDYNVCECLLGMGICWLMIGDLEKSRLYLGKGLDLAEQINSPSLLVDAMVCVSTLFLVTEDIDSAEILILQALGIAMVDNYDLGIGWCYSVLGTVYTKRDDVEAASLYFQESITHLKRSGALIHQYNTDEIQQVLDNPPSVPYLFSSSD